MGIVRAVDVGYGWVKYVRGRTPSTIECGKFPSLAPLASWRRLGSAESVRDTFLVTVDGLRYEVGPDAPILRRAEVVRIADDEYINTPQYQALCLGSLAAIGLHQLDTLVLGLPVHSMQRAPVLIERFKGAHTLPGLQVEIGRVLVLAQPVGGYFSAPPAGPSEVTLVVDPGFFTVDWVVMHGNRAQVERCGSHPGGVHAVLTTVAEGISAAIGRPYRNLDAIDASLVAGAPLRVQGAAVDLSQHLRRAEARILEDIAAITASVGSGLDVDRVLLVGGGAAFYRAALQQRFRMTPEIPVDPEFANVRGFQLVGEQMAAH